MSSTSEFGSHRTRRASCLTSRKRMGDFYESSDRDSFRKKRRDRLYPVGELRDRKKNSYR
jgi:hypothetical protein